MGSAMDLTATGEAGRGHVSTSSEHGQCKIDESVTKEQVGGQCLSRVVRMVKEADKVADKYKGKSDLGAVHLWREDLPEEIKAVLKKYDDVFRKDLPPGLAPIRKGA